MAGKILKTTTYSGDGDVLWASNYGNLAIAISTIGATEATLIIDSSESLLLDATFPSTLSVEIMKPGYITIATGKVLTVNGPFKGYLGHIFRGSGTVTGSPKMKVFYPQWTGATGDGITDDSAAIEKAITASTSMEVPCCFPQMVYDITSNVNITTPYAFLVGEGTLLDGYLNVGNVGMGAVQDMHMKIEGLSFDNDNGYSLVFQNSRYLEVLNCKFHDNSRAIYFKEGNTGVDQSCRRILISECEFFTPDYAIYSDPRGSGVTFSLLADIEFSSNRIYACQITHFYGRGVDGAVIINNYFFFPGWSDNHVTKCSNVDLDYAANIIISNNQLFEAGLESIKIGHFHNLVVSNNIIWGPGQRDYTNGSAIKLYGGDPSGNQWCSSVVNGNTIWRPTKHGIEIEGPCGFIGVTGNYLWGPGDTEYYYGAGSPGSITHYGCYADNTTQHINVVGNYFHDGAIRLEGDTSFYDAHKPVIATLTANDTTFDVTGTYRANIAQTAARTVTNLTDNGSYNGRILYIRGYNGNTTLQHNANASNGYMFFSGGGNVTLADKRILTMIWATNRWEEVSRNFGGGGDSIWTDEETYCQPNNVVNSGNTGHRIYDAGHTQLGQVAPTTGNNFGGGSCTDGTVLRINHGNTGTPTADGKVPLWVKRYTNKDGTDWGCGAAYFGAVKTGGTNPLHTVVVDTYCQGGSIPASGGVLGSMLIHLKNDTCTAANQDIHNVQMVTYTPSSDYQGQHCCFTNDVCNRYADKGWLTRYAAGWTNAFNASNESASNYDNSCAYSLGSGSGSGKWYIGYECNSIAYDTSLNKGEGIYFQTSTFDTHADCLRAEGSLDMRSGYDIASYYTNSFIVRTGRQNSYTDRMWITSAGNMTLTNTLTMYNNKAIKMKDNGDTARSFASLDTNNDWWIMSNGRYACIGADCSQNNPVLIRINGVNNCQLIRSPDTDSAGKHYVTLV